MHHLARDIGQAEVAASVAICEAFVIDAKKVQHRRMQVVRVNRAVAGQDAVLIGLAMDEAALHAAAGHPGGEAEVVVLASGMICLLMEGRAAKL